MKTERAGRLICKVFRLLFVRVRGSAGDGYKTGNGILWDRGAAYGNQACI